MSSTQPELSDPGFGSRLRYLPPIGVAVAYIFLFGVDDLKGVLLLLLSTAAISTVVYVLFPSLLGRSAADYKRVSEPLDSDPTPTAASATVMVESVGKTDDEHTVEGPDRESLAPMTHLSRRQHPSLGTQIQRVAGGNRCGFPPPSQLGQ